MKKVFFILLICISMCGCANQQLNQLKEIDKGNRLGLIEAYDDALERTKVERLDLENQLVDLQSDYDLAIMAFEIKTGESFDDVTSSAFISLNELAAHRQKVEEGREQRRKDILKAYAKFYATIDNAKDPKLMEAIEEIEAERSKTQSSVFGSIFDVIKKIIPGV